MVLNDSRSDREYTKFIDIGAKKTAVLVNDMTVASNKLAISAESVSFSAGAAGTTGTVGLDKAPIYNASGANLGDSSDTSFSWVTGTILTTEVAFNEAQSDTVQLDAMSNGQFAIHYPTGKIRYKKATTGTSDTCNYSTRQMNVEVTGGDSTITIGLVQIDGQNAMTAGTKTVTAAATPEAIGSSTTTKWVLVQAKPANTGTVSIGDSSNQYVSMTAGESVVLSVNNLSKIYAKVSVNGEGVNFLYGV
jgi:hypothetical protein